MYINVVFLQAIGEIHTFEEKNGKKRDLAYLFVKKENLILRANICDVQNNQKLEILEKFSKPSRYAYGYE